MKEPVPSPAERRARLRAAATAVAVAAEAKAVAAEAAEAAAAAKAAAAVAEAAAATFNVWDVADDDVDDYNEASIAGDETNTDTFTGEVLLMSEDKAASESLSSTKDTAPSEYSRSVPLGNLFYFSILKKKRLLLILLLQYLLYRQG